MASRSRKRELLMLVDRPRLLLEVLCSLIDDDISRTSFGKRLAERMGRKSIHVKTIDTYFYTSTTYDLLVPIQIANQPPMYRLSSVGELLCGLYDEPSKRNEYERTLASVLLTNPRKGELFKEFLNFLRDPKTSEEIYGRFQQPTGKTLIAWSLETGLILKRDEFFCAKEEKVSCPPTLDMFLNVLVQGYRQLQKGQSPAAIYVDISSLRSWLVAKLGLDDAEDFDKYLRDLLRTPKGRSIVVHGAPTHILETYRGKKFTYHGKDYILLSIEGMLNGI